MAVNASYKRMEDGWWQVQVGKQVVVGRTLVTTRRKVAKALGVQETDLIDKVQLPPEVQSAVRAYKKARAQADLLPGKRSLAVALLVRTGLSNRDVGTVLCIPHQTVHYIRAGLDPAD